MSKQAVASKGGRGARQRILDTAAELFYRDGINATGVERLAAESSVSKRTLYQHFPSKTAVVEEYLRGIEQRVNRLSTDTSDQTPRERLLAVFEAPTAPGRTATRLPVPQRGRRGRRNHAGGSGNRSRLQAQLHRRTQLSWPNRQAPPTRDNWATSSRCSMKVRPHWPRRSTTRHRGRAHETAAESLIDQALTR